MPLRTVDASHSSPNLVARWLRRYLRHGPRPVVHVRAAARAAGFGEEEIGHVLKRPGFGCEHRWVSLNGEWRWCVALADPCPSASSPASACADRGLLPELYVRYRSLIERDSGGARDWLSWQVAVGAVLADLFELAGEPQPPELRDFARDSDQSVVALFGAVEDDLPF